MTSDPSSRDGILAYAKESFGFLERAGSKRVTADDTSTGTTLAYILDLVTIEVELDWREGFVMVLVCRTVDGKRPPGYYAHEGKRMRVHLAEVLDSGTEEDRTVAKELRQVVKRSGPDAMRAQIDAFAAALRGVLDRLPEIHARFFAD